MNETNEKITELKKENENIFQQLEEIKIEEIKKINNFKNYIDLYVHENIKKEKPESMKYKNDFSLNMRLDSTVNYTCVFSIGDKDSKFSILDHIGKIEYIYKKYDYNGKDNSNAPLDERLDIEHRGIRYQSHENNKHTPKEILEIQQYINLYLINIYQLIKDENENVNQIINECKALKDKNRELLEKYNKNEKQIENEENLLKIEPIEEYIQLNLTSDEKINSIIDDITNKIDSTTDGGLYFSDMKSSDYFYSIEPFNSNNENAEINLIKHFITVEKTLKGRNSFSIEKIKIRSLELGQYMRDVQKMAKKNIVSYLKESECMIPNQFLDNYYDKNRNLPVDEFIHECKNLLLYKNLNEELDTGIKKRNNKNIL